MADDLDPWGDLPAGPFVWRDPADIPARTDEERARYAVTADQPATGDLRDPDEKWRRTTTAISRLGKLQPGTSDYSSALDDYVDANGYRLSSPYVWRDPVSIPRREYVYGRELQRGTVSALLAPGGAGKTMYSVGRALSLATGRALLGKPVHGGPQRVWIWNLEDDDDELARMVQAACKHWGIVERDLGGRLMIDSIRTAPIMKIAAEGPDGFTINEALADMLREELVEMEIDVLHIDPFVSAHRANESDNGQVDAMVKRFVTVAQSSHSAICLAHHVSKAGAADVNVFSSRGAVALTDACRSVLTLNRMSEDEASRYGIEDEGRRRYFRTYDDKNNRAPPSDKSDWFNLHSVDLGNDRDGEQGDSVGVVIPWIPPDYFEGVTVDHLLKVQHVIAEGEWKAHHSATDWAGVAVAGVFGLDVTKKADKARILSMLSQWQANKRFKIDEHKDQKTRQIKKFLVVDQWADDRPATPNEGIASQGIATSQSSATLHPLPLGEGGVAGAAQSVTPDSHSSFTPPDLGHTKF